MKKYLSLITLLLLSLVASAAPRFTSDFYKADPVTHLNKVVMLQITSAKPSSFAEFNGYVSFLCYTAYKDELGGIAWVYVPASKAKSFSRNYGQVKAKIVKDGYAPSFPSKPLKVKMIELDGEYVFVAQ